MALFSAALEDHRQPRPKIVCHPVVAPVLDRPRVSVASKTSLCLLWQADAPAEGDLTGVTSARQFRDLAVAGLGHVYDGNCVYGGGSFGPPSRPLPPFVLLKVYERHEKGDGERASNKAGLGGPFSPLPVWPDLPFKV